MSAKSSLSKQRNSGGEAILGLLDAPMKGSFTLVGEQVTMADITDINSMNIKSPRVFFCQDFPNINC